MNPGVRVDPIGVARASAAITATAGEFNTARTAVQGHKFGSYNCGKLFSDYGLAYVDGMANVQAAMAAMSTAASGCAQTINSALSNIVITDQSSDPE